MENSVTILRLVRSLLQGFIVMTSSNRLKSVKAWLGPIALALRYSVLPVLTTKVRQTILHSITDIMAAAADVMDVDTEQARDRAGTFDQSNPYGSPPPVPGE
jgi:hypothetical protein